MENQKKYAGTQPPSLPQWNPHDSWFEGWPLNEDCAHPQSALKTIRDYHVKCMECGTNFYSGDKKIQRENDLALKYARLDGIIKEIQNIIDTNCLGDMNGN